VAESDDSRFLRWLALVRRLEEALGEMMAARAVVTGDVVPKLELRLEKGAPMSALQLCIELEKGEPSVHADPSRVEAGVVVFNPMCLRVDEPKHIASAVRRLLG
jgi:L-seryl-tRNA(Ser) seleniumtransferase